MSKKKKQEVNYLCATSRLQKARVVWKVLLL